MKILTKFLNFNKKNRKTKKQKNRKTENQKKVKK
jgi:hypothetical protein